MKRRLSLVLGSFSLGAIAVAGLFGAELIHTAVISQHLREWTLSGWFFLTISIVEGALGAALWFAPSQRVVRAALTISLLTVALWVVSRTVGVPFGPEPWVRGPVGKIDLAATILELITAGALVADRMRGRLVWSQRRLTAGFAAVIAVTAIGLIAGPGPTVQPGSSHGSALSP
jgi:hypothetical protein